MTEHPKIEKTTIEQMYADGSRVAWTIDGHYYFSRLYPNRDEAYGVLLDRLTISESVTFQFAEIDGLVEMVYTPPPAKFEVGDKIAAPAEVVSGYNVTSYWQVYAVNPAKPGQQTTYHVFHRDGKLYGELTAVEAELCTKIEDWPLRKGDFVEYKNSPNGGLYKVLGPGILLQGKSTSVHLQSEYGRKHHEYECVLRRVEGVRVNKTETWKRPTDA